MASVYDFIPEVLIWPTTQASKCINVEASNETVSWFTVKAAQWEAAVQLLAEMRPLFASTESWGRPWRLFIPTMAFAGVLFFINWAFSNQTCSSMLNPIRFSYFDLDASLSSFEYMKQLYIHIYVVVYILYICSLGIVNVHSELLKHIYLFCHLLLVLVFTIEKPDWTHAAGFPDSALTPRFCPVPWVPQPSASTGCDGVMGPGLVCQLWVRKIIASASVGQLPKVSSFANVASMLQFYAKWGKIDSHYILIQFNSAARSKSPTIDGKDMAVNSRTRHRSWKMVGFHDEVPFFHSPIDGLLTTIVSL